MGRTALRRAIVVLTAALVLTVAFSPGAHAADAGLTAAMLDTGDMPAGFMPDASLTGPLTGQRAQELGLNPGQTWSPGHLGAHLAGGRRIRGGRDRGQRRHRRPGPGGRRVRGVRLCRSRARPGSLWRASTFTAGSWSQYFELVLLLARGPYLFGVHVLAPASSAGPSRQTDERTRRCPGPQGPGRYAGHVPGCSGQRCLRRGRSRDRAPSSATCCWLTASATCAIRCGAHSGGHDPGASGRNRRGGRRRGRRRRRRVGGRQSAAGGSPSAGWRSSWAAWAWWPTRPTCSSSASGTRTWWRGWP